MGKKSDLPTHAPCLKDMRGQKMLWMGWDPCWMGKLLFSCRVPSLSTTLLKGFREHTHKHTHARRHIYNCA